MELGFTITAHKVQGQTMGNVLVDLVGCFGTEPICYGFEKYIDGRATGPA